MNEPNPSPHGAPLGTPASGPPPFPERLRKNLTGFRSAMRRSKLAEAGLAAGLSLLVSFLAVALLDRFFETDALLRGVLFFVSLGAALLIVPRALSRWYMRHSDLREVAREISLDDAAAGDRLLGVFELTRDRAEFERSPDLVRAAVAQGDQDYGDRDLSRSLPKSRHRGLAAAIALPAAAAVGFAVMYPAVASNAFARWSQPFSGVERYTFARLDGLTNEWVVPIQEERGVSLRLDESTRTRPEVAELRYSGGTIEAPLEDGSYHLALPPMAGDQSALLVVGDVRQTIDLAPRERPEVVAATATVELPEYLELPETLDRDVRGGSLSVVEGAEVSLALELSRAVASGQTVLSVGSADAAPDAPRTEQPGTFHKSDTIVRVDGLRSAPDAPVTAEVEWIDELGLEGHGPFSLAVRPRADESPSVALSGVNGEVVLLESVALTFDVIGNDDFGIRQMGLEWREVKRRLRGRRAAQSGPAEDPMASPPLGEKILTAGAPDATSLEAFATFRPTTLGVTSGLYEVRGWAVDALPGRERSVSSPIRVLVMTADEHMEWITRKLDRWTETAIEVRDRELMLLSRNKELLAMTNAELDSPEMRARLENQSRAERANRARLKGLVSEGQEMLGEAARNSEFNSNVLDDWAESMAKLDRIAQNSMESVASRLKNAAKAPPAGSTDEGVQPAAGEQPSDALAMADPSEGPGQPGQPQNGQQAGEPQEGQPGGEPQDGSKPGKPGGSGESGEAKENFVKKENGGEPQEGEAGGDSKAGESALAAGEDRSTQDPAGGAPSEGENAEETDEPKIPATPTIVDKESSLAEAEAEAAAPAEGGDAGPKPPAPLSLVQTTLGPAPSDGDEEPAEDSGDAEGEGEAAPSMTKEQLALAVAEQEALIEEFNEVAGEIRDVLANLENSTFVRRFKAASRAQGKSARDLDVAVNIGFGSIVATADETVAGAATAAGERRDVELPKLTNLHGDLDAYLGRLEAKASSDAPKFRRVLGEWEDLRPAVVADALVEEAMGGRPGEARASADFLSDTFDRWGEELVGPG